MGRILEKKGIKEEKNQSSSRNKDIKDAFFKSISNDEKFVIERVKELVGVLKAKYRLSTRDVLYLVDDKDILVPVSIFSKKLTLFEALTKYLKEELNLSYHDIGTFLNRDERNIWQTYNKANKKDNSKLNIESSKYFIPLSIFQNKLSILENITLYMKEELNLSYHDIGILLERNERTVWTMCNRARKKLNRNEK